MLEEPEVQLSHQSKSRSAHIFRISVIVLMGGITAAVFGAGTSPFFDWLYKRLNNQEYRLVNVAVVSSVVLGFILGAGLGNLILKGFGILVQKWDRMDSGDKVTLFTGILVGMLVTPLFLIAFDPLVPPAYLPFVPFVTLGLTAGLATLCTYVLHSMSDVLPWTRGRARAKRTGMKLLDTNVIIDGRIYDVARTGFLEGDLYVPGFVLDELQYIADSHDPLRRQRGRRGLDVLRHLQSDFQLEVRSHDRLAPEGTDGVDSRLVRLARAMGADIVTNDFNLNRVAALQQVKVLNINDLALGLRPNVLPSETLTISVVREGNQPLQGIGYLEDGTMVVVENGKGHIGETLDVVVSQVIQTERGKMIFAEVPENLENNGHDYSRRRSGSSRRP